MQMAFYYDQSRCTGCCTCQTACKKSHDGEPGTLDYRVVLYIEKGEPPNLYSAYLNLSCLHCADPKCAEACPVDAITKREEDGIVVVDRELCLGKEDCPQLCKEMCPYNTPGFGDEENAKMQKCDFCVDRLPDNGVPVCVAACPRQALDAGPLDKLIAKYGDIKQAEGFVYSEESKPSVVFKPKRK